MISIRQIEVEIKKAVSRAKEIAGSTGSVSIGAKDYVSSPVALLSLKDKRMYFFKKPPSNEIIVNRYTTNDDKNAIRASVNEAAADLYGTNYDAVAEYLISQSIATIAQRYPSYAKVLFQFKRVKQSSGTMAIGASKGDSSYRLYYNPQFVCQQVITSIVYNVLMDPNYKIDQSAVLTSTVFTLMHEIYHVAKGQINATLRTDFDNPEWDQSDFKIFNYTYDAEINTEIASFLPMMHGAIKYDAVGEGSLMWVRVSSQAVRDIVSGGLHKDDAFLEPFVGRLNSLVGEGTRFGEHDFSALWINWLYWYKDFSPKQVGEGLNRFRKMIGNPEFIRDMVDVSDYIDDAIKEVSRNKSADKAAMKLREIVSRLPAYVYDSKYKKVVWAKLVDTAKADGQKSSDSATRIDPKARAVLGDDHISNYFKPQAAQHDYSPAPPDAGEGTESSVVMWEDYAGGRFRELSDSDVVTRIKVLSLLPRIDEGGIYKITGDSFVLALGSAELSYDGESEPDITDKVVKCYAYRGKQEIDVPCYHFTLRLFHRDDFVEGTEVVSRLFNGVGLFRRHHESGYSGVIELSDGVFRNVAYPELRIVRRKDPSMGNQDQQDSFPYPAGSMVVRVIGGKTYAFWVMGKTEDGKAVLKTATADEYKDYVAVLRMAEKYSALRGA